MNPCDDKSATILARAEHPSQRARVAAVFGFVCSAIGFCAQFTLSWYDQGSWWSQLAVCGYVLSPLSAVGLVISLLSYARSGSKLAKLGILLGVLGTLQLPTVFRPSL
jgi:hypothetical protein